MSQNMKTHENKTHKLYDIKKWQTRIVVGNPSEVMGFHGKRKRHTLATEVITCLHMEETTHAHIELRFKIPLRQELHQQDRENSRTMSVTFVGRTRITFEEEKDPNSEMAKLEPLGFSYGSFGRLSLQWLRQPTVWGSFDFQPDIRPENLRQVQRYVNGTFGPSGTAVLYLNVDHKDPQRYAPHIEKIVGLMDAQSMGSELLNPQKHPQRIPCFLKQHLIQPRSRPVLFYATKDKTEKLGRNVFLDFVEYLTILIYAHAYEHEIDEWTDSEAYLPYFHLAQDVYDQYALGQDQRLLHWTTHLTGQNPLSSQPLDLFSGYDALPHFRARSAQILAKLFGYVRNTPGRLMLIEGAPGTGKTHFVAALTVALTVKASVKVLILTPNITTGNIVTKKLHRMNENLAGPKMTIVRAYSSDHQKEVSEAFLRLSSIDAMHDTLPYHILKQSGMIASGDVIGLTQQQDTFRSLLSRRSSRPESMTRLQQNIYAHLVDDFRRLALAKVDVVVATSVAALSRGFSEKFPAQTIMIDEASRFYELASALVVCLYKPKFVLLFGDSRQLQPAIRSKTAAENPYRPQALLSWFLRAKNFGNASMTLETQYRQAGGNHLIISERFYRGALRDALFCTSVAIRPGAQLFLQMIRDEFNTGGVFMLADRPPQLYIDMEESAAGNRDEYSRIQSVALIVHIVQKFLRRFRGTPFTASDITVLTPFRSQIRLLDEAFRAQAENGSREFLQIVGKTPETMAGDENTFVIFDAVKSGSKRGYFMDPRCLNVCLSRARDGFIMIGSYSPTGLDIDVSEHTKAFWKIAYDFRARGHYCRQPEYPEDQLKRLVSPGQTSRKRKAEDEIRESPAATDSHPLPVRPKTDLDLQKIDWKKRFRRDDF